MKKFGLVFLATLAAARAMGGTPGVSDLSVTKSGPAKASAGSDVTYTISVTNLGPDPSGAVTLNDPTPAGMTFVSATAPVGWVCTTPLAGDSGGAVNCTIATLANAATASFTVVFNIPASTAAGTTLTNSATATTATDSNTANNTATADTTTPFSDLAVTKDGPATAAAGSDVTYTITVLNLGPDASEPVALNDPTPPGMTFVSATAPGGWVCTTPSVGEAGGSVNCTIGTLANGASATFTVVYNIPLATPPGTTFTNIAAVSSPSDPSPENDTGVASTNTPFPPQGDLFIQKNGPGSAGPGSNVIYTIMVGNTGPDDGTNVAWTDTLPGTMTFVSLSSPGGWSCTTPAVGSGGTVLCTTPTLTAGSTATFTLTGQIPPATISGTPFINTATVSSDNDPDVENNSSTTGLTVSSVDMSVVKAGPATVTAGNNISYTIVVGNGGPDAGNLILNDPLPAGTTFVSMTQNSGPAADFCLTPAVGSSGPVSCAFSIFGNGASAQFTLVAAVGNAATLTNTATVSTSGFDTNAANDSSTVMTTVTQSADLAISKNGSGAAFAGTNEVYSVTITNSGPTDAQAVALSETPPAGTTLVSITQSSGPPSPGTLSPGESMSFIVTLHINADVANGTVLTNQVQVTSSTPDPNAGNNTATAPTTVTTLSDIVVTKSGAASVATGGNATYTIAVGNNGPSDAQTVSLTDATPPNTTFSSLTQTSGPTFTCTPPAVGASGTVTCTIATMPANTAAMFTLVVQVSAAAPSGSTITNTATATTTTNDPAPANNTASTTATVNAADTAISKTGPANGAAGGTATYVITVSNIGTADATTVAFTDVLPANTTFQSLTQTNGPTFTCTTPAPGAAGTIDCSIGTLPIGASGTFDLIVNIPLATPVGTTISNTVTVTSANPDANGANNTSTTTFSVSASVPALSSLMLALLAASLSIVAYAALKR